MIKIAITKHKTNGESTKSYLDERRSLRASPLFLLSSFLLVRLLLSIYVVFHGRRQHLRWTIFAVSFSLVSFCAFASSNQCSWIRFKLKVIATSGAVFVDNFEEFFNLYLFLLWEKKWNIRE
jgi:hypothetical protein